MVGFSKFYRDTTHTKDKVVEYIFLKVLTVGTVLDPIGISFTFSDMYLWIFGVFIFA